jgi:hypothetical protein
LNSGFWIHQSLLEQETNFKEVIAHVAEQKIFEGKEKVPRGKQVKVDYHQ